MESFKFQWKSRWFWKTRVVVGFGYQRESDRMTLNLPDGGLYEIANWSKYDCFLGSDFFRIQHAKMEKEAGQAIPVSIVKE